MHAGRERRRVYLFPTRNLYINVPITLGRIFVIKSEKVYFSLGANADFLRGTPIILLAGVIWIYGWAAKWTADRFAPIATRIFSRGNYAVRKSITKMSAPGKIIELIRPRICGSN